mmetsp:Transcript_11890/g.37949  ORF Transcript_11890/g.37949 Transcript_11890/m.37949 type:complete len:263 (-) Transcript_11890:140-928(-)
MQQRERWLRSKGDVRQSVLIPALAASTAVQAPLAADPVRRDVPARRAHGGRRDARHQAVGGAAGAAHRQVEGEGAVRRRLDVDARLPHAPRRRGCLRAPVRRRVGLREQLGDELPGRRGGDPLQRQRRGDRLLPHRRRRRHAGQLRRGENAAQHASHDGGEERRAGLGGESVSRIHSTRDADWRGVGRRQVRVGRVRQPLSVAALFRHRGHHLWRAAPLHAPAGGPPRGGRQDRVARPHACARAGRGWRARRDLRVADGRRL